MTRIERAAPMLLVLMMAGATAAPMTPDATNTDLNHIVIPMDEALVLTEPLHATTIDVFGLLTHEPSTDLELHAERLIVHPGGAIIAPSGANGASDHQPFAAGNAGSHGSNVTIRATHTQVHPDAWILAGNGGSGGHALGDLQAVGGNGGNGGSVRIESQWTAIQGWIIPGSGGKGGDARTLEGNPNDALHHATGGNGGDSGSTQVNNAMLLQAYPSTPITHRLERYLPVPPCPSVPGPDTDRYIEFRDMPNGVPEPGCSSGGSSDLCDSPTGEDGEDNPLGAGGDGGDGCSEVIGDDGAHGRDGSSGPFNCRSGGSGGVGTSTSTGTTQGGQGGLGQTHGGAGGDAWSISNGGHGGNGGSGGTRLVGSNCSGGNGGNGGNAVAGTSTGGNGGTGLCGNGGTAGNGSASANSGTGGAGGPGNPSGLAGATGSSTSGASIGGTSGTGLSVCQSII